MLPIPSLSTSQGMAFATRKTGSCSPFPKPPERTESQTVSWQQLAEVIRNADSQRRIVWLDCCYAGLALPDKEATPDKDPPELLEVAKVEGTYLLAAAQKYGEAKSPDGEKCTAFTGELVNALRDGIAPGPPTQEFLSLNSLHQQVRSALRTKHLPEPTRHDPDNIGQLPHFHNNMTRQRNPRVVRSRATRTQQPSSPFPMSWASALPCCSWPFRAAARHTVAGPGAFLNSVADHFHVSAARGAEPDRVLLDSRSARSARNARFHGHQANCVQPINLDAACDFQYQKTGLKDRFTSSDPDSAICYNPTTHVRYSAGISNMAGYCATLTTMAGVTATAANLDYKNTWVCQVAINMSLACDTQNNRTNLVARQVNGIWMCYIA